MPDFVLASYGLVWLASGLVAAYAPPYIYVFLAGIIIALSCSALLRRPPQTTVAQDGFIAREQRMLYAVLIIQGVSIAAATAILTLLHRAEYAAAAVAIIVGLHLLPLARKRFDVDRLTSALLVSWSAGCILLCARNQVAAHAAFGAGTVAFAGVFFRWLRTPKAGVVSGT